MIGTRKPCIQKGCTEVARHLMSYVRLNTPAKLVRLHTKERNRTSFEDL